MTLYLLTAAAYTLCIVYVLWELRKDERNSEMPVTTTIITGINGGYCLLEASEQDNPNHYVLRWRPRQFNRVLWAVKRWDRRDYFSETDMLAILDAAEAITETALALTVATDADPPPVNWAAAKRFSMRCDCED